MQHQCRARDLVSRHGPKHDLCTICNSSLPKSKLYVSSVSDRFVAMTTAHQAEKTCKTHTIVGGRNCCVGGRTCKQMDTAAQHSTTKRITFPQPFVHKYNQLQCVDPTSITAKLCQAESHIQELFIVDIMPRGVLSPLRILQNT